MEIADGKLAFGFKPASEETWNTNAKTVAEKLVGWGFEVIVFDAEMYSNHRDVSDVSTAGQTICDPEDPVIFISADLNADGVETAYHEAFHAMKARSYSGYYNQLIDVISENVDTDCEAFERFIDSIAGLYAYMKTDIPIWALEREIVDEFYAWYIGKTHANDGGIFAEYIGQFSDIGEVKVQIDRIYEEIGRSRGGAF